MSKQILFGGKITRAGSDQGSATSWRSVYDKYSRPGSIGYVDGVKLTSDNFENSIIKSVGKLRINKQVKNILLYKLSDDVMDDPTLTFWYLINCGSLLTGETFSSGNIQAIMNNSISAAFYEFSEETTEETKKNLLTCLTWYMKCIHYMINNNYWNDAYEAFLISLKSPSVTNVLRQLIPSIILKMKDIKIDGVDDWKIFSLVMTSISRTYHDMKCSLSSAEAMNRLFVLFVILSIEDKKIDNVVKTSMDSFIHQYKKIYEECDNENVAIIAIMIRKIFNSDIDDSIELSKIVLKMIEPKKVPFLNKSDIRKFIKDDFKFNGEILTQFTTENTMFKYGTSIINDSSINYIESNYKNASDWTTFAINIDKILEDNDSFEIDIEASYDKGAYGNPGVRFYCLDSDMYGLPWRKKYKMGITTNGGYSDGFGRPSGNMKAVVKEDFVNTYKNLAKIKFDGRKLKIKLYNWTNYCDINYSHGEDLVIAHKAFNVKAKINTKEKYHTIGGASLYNLTFSEIVKKDTSGKKLATALFK